MNKEWLINEYVIKDRSTQDIADEYGCKQNTIQCWLVKHNIKKDKKKQIDSYDYLYDAYVIKNTPIRIIAQNNHTTIYDIKRRLRNFDIPLRDEPRKLKYDNDLDDIVSLYYEDGLSAFKIGEKYNTSHNIIINLLHRHGYKTRNMSDAQFVSHHIDVSEIFYDADKLNKLHNELKISCKDIGDLIGVSAGAVRRQMHRFGLHTNDCSESKVGLLTGESHPNWKGGKTSLYNLLREYYNTNLSPKAKERDGYKCIICGQTDDTLHGHHIIPFNDIVNEICSEHPELDRDNPDDKQLLYFIITNDPRFLDLNNIQTLCRKCHIKIHSKTISNQASEEEGSETIPTGSTP